MKIKNLIAAFVILIIAASCSTPKDVVYFQDVKAGSELYSTAISKIRIIPGDQLNINVSCSDQRLTDMFNISYASRNMSGNNNQAIVGYFVDSKGDIDYPVIGTIHVGGLTREEVAEKIKSEIQKRDLVKDPVVTVGFMNLGLAVMGEVGKPGRINIAKDRITILDALAAAGDLTINGRRDNVIIIRNEGDKQKVYTVDLTNAASVYGSPVYYLQQDDVIYVSPNDKMIRQSTANGNTLLTYGFWLSLGSFLMSVAVLIFK